MNKRLLQEWLEQGLSLKQIATRTGRDPSTVGYWVQKHGLAANGKAKYAPRGGLTREELSRLVDRGLTLREMAVRLDRSTSTVRHWLVRYGLKTSRHHRNRERAIDAIARGEKRFLSNCRKHGDTQFLVLAEGRSRCARCNNESVSNQRRKSKRTLVEEHGGRCVLCGYDRHIGALQFHHNHPEEKKFAVSRAGVTIALQRSREEAEKCTLLCANCQAEVEGGVASLKRLA